ncbi:hypothetical protein AB0368_06440 [Actinoplanes sp. NPDC051475]|uniref:hypothetical protein n=1 Tax=Actinoplanes sp. NPDC051475 TaxID=3157225 RepID=UPI00344D799C
MSLVAAPLSVLLVSADEQKQIFDESFGDSVGRNMRLGDKANVRRNAELMRYTATTARILPGMSKVEAEQRLIDAYERGLPILVATMPLRFSTSEADRMLTAWASYSSPAQDELVAAWLQYGHECLAELDRTYARGTTSPQAPTALDAAEKRLAAAADTWERAENLSRQGKVDKAIRQIRQKHERKKIAVPTVLGAGGLLAAVAAVTLARRRRRTESSPSVSRPGLRHCL